MQINKATHVQLDLTSDLQKWRAFLAIAELGSLTRAALFLDSNQSLLSRRLNALERECKARLEAIPERLVWGSDWPHLRVTPEPDAAQLLARFKGWAGSESVANQILKVNPEVLYR